MVKQKKKIVKIQDNKSCWNKMSAWLKGGVIGALFGLIAGLPVILLTLKINVYQWILVIANYIYLPVLWSFIKLIFVPLSKAGIILSNMIAFTALIIFGIIFYFVFGALIGWLVKKIIEKRKEIKK
jgi:hypothetical protein